MERKCVGLGVLVLLAGCLRVHAGENEDPRANECQEKLTQLSGDIVHLSRQLAAIVSAKSASDSEIASLKASLELSARQDVVWCTAAMHGIRGLVTETYRGSEQVFVALYNTTTVIGGRTFWWLGKTYRGSEHALLDFFNSTT
eukprot:2254400-Pyramimonas_sp.AAC.1